MRTAIVHYWLLGMRGGERVVEALCRLLPNADIFTLFYDPERVSEEIRSHRVFSSFLNRYRRYYRSLLPLMPLALEQFDLRDYDLVISSESGPAKGVITSSRTRHICYCHSPMRYLWDLYPNYTRDWTHSRFRRLAIPPLANYLRLWDYASAARVDEFVANSQNVRRRIWKTYRREARVIYPPVDVGSFYSADPDDYYLIVSELVAYKRVGDAVASFSRSGRKLKIVGDGPEFRSLRAAAGPEIEFCGRVPEEQLRQLYAHARAVVIPGEEDFGIVAVEAVASGKPLIAIGRGGVLEAAPPDYSRGAFLYKEPGECFLTEAVVEFEKVEPYISATGIQAHAAKFSEKRFFREMSDLIWDPEFVSATESGCFYKTFTSEK
ncbi:MAG TPA: glycosyltransferase [Bryobacteraceae bacterium]|jgi:glycosyltransferase involved in cell wall biosynthesis|nr:glycosyltransferase [Bryobacteraceae bacterium]